MENKAKQLNRGQNKLKIKAKKWEKKPKQLKMGENKLKKAKTTKKGDKKPKCKETRENG